MRLSIVIPAFNEEKELPNCLASVRAAIVACAVSPEDVEVVVCDNNSTDCTAELARKGRARVVFEPQNQIGRARNAGAAIARGAWLLFIDADSRLHPENLRRVLEFAGLDGPVIGGGSTIGLDGLPGWARHLEWLWTTVSLATRWAAGSFLFCRADAFREVGGFNVELFAAEEIDLSRRLKKWARRHNGKFVILRGQPHVSSARKFHLYSARELLRYSLDVVFRYRKLIRSRDRLAFFYDGRR